MKIVYYESVFDPEFYSISSLNCTVEDKGNGFN